MKKRNVLFMITVGMLLCTGCHAQNPENPPESITIIQEEKITEGNAEEDPPEPENPVKEADTEDVAATTEAAAAPNTAGLATTVNVEGAATVNESASAKEEQTSKGTTPVPGKMVIEGSQFADGREAPVTVSMTLEKTQRGEEAYETLASVDKNIPKPGGDEEYIIFTFDISYDDGELDEIDLMENRSSLENAGLYFALSNGDSNAEDMTGYVSDSIYELVISKGTSAKGEVAFLHKTGVDAPLHFVGFGRDTVFAVEKADGAAKAVSVPGSDTEAILYGMIGDLGLGYLAYSISGQSGEDYRLCFLASQESRTALSEVNISLEKADYIFPDVRAGNAAIGDFSDIYFLDTADLTGDDRAELFIIARYDKDGRKYFDTRIYEMNENGASVRDDLTRKLNEKYCNAEDYPDYPVKVAKELFQK